MMKKLILAILCAVMSIGLSVAQTRTISGIVTSAEDGEAVIGAAIQVKGTLTGTVTDVSGNFSLDVPASAKTLVVSYIGMETQEVAIQANMRITLQTSSVMVDEVVVTAMGISREKKSIGYAAQEIKAGALTQTRQADLNNALVGKVSGVRFWGSSGATFDSGKVILRGTSSLTSAQGSEPIYVVDGVITSVNAVNMDDVESVNVLKGPAATAIYGSRGGNGAVIITSKKGSAVQGKSQFEFNQSFVMEEVVMHSSYQNQYGGGSLGADGELMTFEYDPSIHPSYLEKLNGVRYYDMENDVSWGPRFDGQPYAPFYAWDPSHPKFGQTAPWSGQSQDNLKELYKTGLASTTGVSFSKSGEKYNIRTSFTNVNRSGVVENSDAVRRYFSVSANYDISDRFKVSADYKYTYRRNHNAAVEGYGGTQNFAYSYTQWFHRNVDINSLKDYRRPDGTFRSWNPISITNLNPKYHDNPYALMNEIDRIRTDNWNVITGTAKFDIIKNKLTIGASVHANLQNSQGDGATEVIEGELKVPYNILGETPRYEINQNSLSDVQMQGFLSFHDRYLNDQLDVSGQLFIEQRDRDYRNIESETTDGLTSDRYFNMAASVGKPNTFNTITQQKERSVFGTGMAGWKNTYYIDFSLRNDWTSTLPADKNSYLYGGLSLSTIVSNFMENVSWLDFWKLRASVAQVGSAMRPYQVLEIYEFQDKYGSNSAMRMDRNLKNPHIRPTISTSFEAGTEFRLIKNRLWGDVNFYTRDSKDQILDVNVAPASGYTTSKINAGKIRNRGYEISLSGIPVQTKDFSWELYANFSKHKNTLEELNADDPETTQYRLTYYGLSTYLYMFAEVGKPIGVIRGSSYEKSPDGQIIYTKRAEGSPYGEATPLRKTTGQDELGNVQPDATGGFGTSFSWKSLRLALGFDYQIGGQVASVSNMFGEGSGLLSSTVGQNDRGGDIRSNVWTNNGGIKVTGVTREGTGENAVYTPFTGYMDALYYYTYASSIWEPYVYDASYLKLREISVTYTLPASMVRSWNIGLSDARVSLIAQNPWVIYSAIPNVDASSIGSAWNNYMELGQSFSTRSWGVSFNLTF